MVPAGSAVVSRKTVDLVVHPPAIGRLLDGQALPDWRVAAELGIHPTALSLYRSGDRYIHDRHAEALAGFFGVTVEELRGPVPAVEAVGSAPVVQVEDDFDPWDDPA